VEIKLINLTKGEKKIMENKPSMSRVERLHREKVTRYSIRKYSFGAASVAVAALFMFLGNGAVSVQADQIQPGDTATAQPATPALDKTQLESYISEVKSKLSAGKYANKTEESLALLNGKLASAESVLASATTQDELTTAYQKLVMFVSSGLKNKPKEAPKVDTTNGQPTVGKKAENTEPKSDSNSIENTGSNDARNGKELDKNNAFRTEPDTEKPKVSIDYDDAASRTIWVTPTEETNITGRIKITDNSGKIVKGWMQKMGSGTETDIGYGLHNSNIDREATATADHPATLSITGKLQDRHPNGNPWTNGSTVVSRKVRAKDASNNEIDNEGSSDPATYQVFFKVRSQNVKYTEALANKAANFDKVAVANPAQLQQPELDKIKDKLQEGDGNNLNGKIATVTQSGDKVVITYNDGTTAERPVTDFTRVNQAPTAEFPFSNAAAKEIYVYGAEENSFDIKIKDDSKKIVSATLNQGGNRPFAEVPGATNKISTQYGYTATTITAETPATEASPAVITYSGTPAPEGNFTQDKLDAATRGETPPGVVLGWRFLRVTDADGGEITGRATGADDPGSFVVVLKPQTQKYDVTKPENEAAKVPVVDANKVTDAEFKKLVGANNANIKLHYSKTNTDANLVAKQGQNVDDKADKIKSVTKVDNNMVVTYKDGSTDTLPLTDFARTNAAPTVEIPYSLDGKKDVYVYANEDFEIPIKFTDDSGKIASANVLRGGNNESPVKDASNPNVLNNEFNTTVEKISTETVATAENPAIVKIQGNISKDNSGIPASSFPKEQDQELKIVTRYATATDTDGRELSNIATSDSYAKDPGSFTIKLKAQTAKYDIKTPETKVPVVDANNVTEAEFNEIKKNIKIQYSTENPDKNLADKKGKEVENQDDRIESITKDGNNVVVTYKDGSKDTKPLTDFARTNPAPTVELPYSNPDKKQIYVYTGENTDLTFKASDDAEVKDLYLRGPGGVGNDNTAGYGFTTGKIDNDVVTNGEGKVSDDKRTATIKMTGVTTLTAPNQWTSFVVANDNDNASSFPAGQNYDATTDDAVRQQKPGYVQFIVKNQTSKYDIAAPTEKVAVTDPANVTEAELEKIKEKLQIEYSNNNDDANLADKKGKTVDAEDAKTKIASVTKDDQGNLVVTYTDGSTDKKPLSEFVTLDKQPAINEVNKAAEKQIEAINNNPEATKEEKDKAIEQVNADKAKALEDIANSTATTKPELDKVEKAGTDKIKTDNPVLSKKPAAKQAIDDALAAKNKAIDARPDLTPEEKTKAKEAAKAAADKAKEAVDTAKTNADVDTAAGKIGDELKKVNPVAKEAAKKAIADELAKKEKAIDARTDLTKEEKDAAKKEAQDKANEATDAINKQPDIAETPEKAAEAQTAVDGAKDKGVADVKAVNPVAAKKAEAKQAIDDALTAKNQEIDARTDLTPEEKTKAKEVAKAQADVAKAAVDNATTNAAVDKAKADGTTAVANVTPVAKEAAKKAINDALTAKNKEIDARPDLTDEEKTAAKNEAKDKADAQLAKINEQPDTATTPTAAKTAQDAVDAAKKTGVDEVTAVNPVAVKKPAAKKAIDDALKAKEAAIDARPDLTDEEKKAAKDAAKDVADKAKEAIEPAAKKAIDDALKAKEAAIDARPDLTDAEKKAAKDAAKDAADKAKAAVDAAPTDAAVDAAKETGTGDIAKVNPVAKEVAKKAVADELAKKEAAIDARPDLTDEEKAAAKKEAKDKAKAATDAINDQPSIAETPEKAAEAQKAVDAAKKTGVDEVAAVNPEAAKKPAAKKAIDDALKAKEAAIDARPDLTDAEKKAAKDAAKDAADKAKAAVDAAPTDAAVDAAKETGTGDIAKVNPVAKDAAKKAVADELAKKEAAIDARPDLTKEEKDAAKKEAQDKAKEATDAINDQPANAETPEKAAEAQAAVDAAKKTGVDEVAAVNPEAKAKPAAKKAIEDKLAKQLEDIANTPDATDDEKKVAADAAKALAEEAKEEIDKAGTDAEVKQLQKEAEGEIEKSVPVVEDKPNARKAIDEEATAKKAAIDARDDLTPKAKEDLKAQVDAIADQAKKSVDAAKTADAVNGIEESDKAAINAVGEVNIPADKVLVNDPSVLTDDEKAKVLEAVKKVNPDAKEITQDADGNVTVTTPDGHKEIITPEQVVKTADTANDPKAGNDIVKPADKVVVNDPAKLTDAEKEKIKAAVEAVNPNSIVVVDDKGNAKVSTQDGQTQVIPVEELVRTVEDTKKPNAGNDIVKPADKTVVANPEKLTDAEKKAIEDKVKAVNPDATVVVDDKGNATVTTPAGKTAVIPAADLTKDPEAATKPNAGNDIVKPADKTVVANPEKLTDAEKKAIEDKVKAVNPDATVVVDDKGNATVTTPEGKTAVIPATDLTKSPEEAAKPNAGNDIVKPSDKTVVANPEKLTDAEKKAIEDKVKAVNPDATVVVDDKGNATVTTPEGKTAVIPATDLTKSPEEAAKANAGNDIVKPADKTVVANPEKLTDAEKKAIEDKVKAVNPDATVVVDDKGNATVTPKDGEPVVIPAADLTKDPAAATKPNAGNAVNTPASKVEVKDPANLTDEEKAKVKKAIEAVNPGSKVVVDDKGNATVTTPEGNTAVIPAADVTKSAADADKANAGNAVNTPAAKTVVKDPANLTDAEKKAIEDKVKAVNPGSKVVVDDKGNATVTTPEGKTATIPATDLTKSASDAGKENAGNGANTPATKTVVKDPANLTDEEKAKVKKAVEAVNPGVTVVVDEKGNATVTKADGTVLNIPASDLVIPADNLADEAKNAKVKTPVFRTLVENKENLTKDEKEAVKKAIEAVNSGATVVVDEKGNATVTMPDGYTATISKEQLVKDKEAVSKSKHGGDNLDIDLSKVEVADLANITPEEKAKFQFKVLGAITDVPEFDLDAFLKETDDNGNTVYTSKDGKVKITIDKDGNATATVEKDGKTEAAVKIDKDGNVTIVTKEGQVLAIPRDDAFKQRPYVPSNGGGNNSGNGNGTSGNNAANNTDAKVNKAKLEGAIHQLDELIIKESAKLDAETAKEANALSADAKKVFANADATQAEVDAMVKRIEDFMAKVAPSTDHANTANDQSAQTPAVAPATTQAASNASQTVSAQANARKAAKELPNTGTVNSTVAMVAAAASALLGLGLAGRRRKEDEEA